MGNSNSVNKMGKIVVQGRWRIKTPQEVNINTFWNNIDNCGDSICGDVKKSKNLLDKDIDKDIVNKNSTRISRTDKKS